jgi:hypothetical protein
MQGEKKKQICDTMILQQNNNNYTADLILFVSYVIVLQQLIQLQDLRREKVVICDKSLDY